MNYVHTLAVLVKIKIRYPERFMTIEYMQPRTPGGEIVLNDIILYYVWRPWCQVEVQTTNSVTKIVQCMTL